MKRILFALALLCASLTAACTDPDTASRSSLAAMGFSHIDVKWTFAATLNCSESDSWARSFTATGVNGQFVTGTVCGGYVGKGATVRFN